MAITKLQAVDLVSYAIEHGRVLQAKAYSGEGVVTAGPYQLATGERLFAGFWYKRRAPESHTSTDPDEIAYWFVERVGRGAARAAIGEQRRNNPSSIRWKKMEVRVGEPWPEKNFIYQADTAQGTWQIEPLHPGVYRLLLDPGSGPEADLGSFRSLKSAQQAAEKMS